MAYSAADPPPEGRCYPAAAAACRRMLAACLPLAERCYLASAEASRLIPVAVPVKVDVAKAAAALMPVAAMAAVTADEAAAVPSSTTAIAANTTVARGNGRSSRGQC